MSSDSSAVGVLISLMSMSAVFALILFIYDNPLWTLLIVIIWIVFFVSIMAYDRRHWGQPNLNTLGVALSTKTRKPEIGEYKVEGMVMGTCVKTRNIFSAARAELRSLVGGEARQFTDLVDECRNIALTRMCQRAKDMGCNWVLGFRMITAETMWGATEFIAYGTSVRTK
jgi:uncharacterized protein YbjQ (UPF0145 family)